MNMVRAVLNYNPRAQQSSNTDGFPPCFMPRKISQNCLCSQATSATPTQFLIGSFKLSWTFSSSSLPPPPLSQGKKGKKGEKRFRIWTKLLQARLLAFCSQNTFTSITSNFTVMTSAPCWWYSSPYLCRWRLLAKSHPNRTTKGRTSPPCLNCSGQGWTSMLRLTALKWKGLVPKSHRVFDTVDCRGIGIIVRNDIKWSTIALVYNCKWI